jgi:hypothetical protein
MYEYFYFSHTQTVATTQGKAKLAGRGLRKYDEFTKCNTTPARVALRSAGMMT